MSLLATLEALTALAVVGAVLLAIQGAKNLTGRERLGLVALFVVALLLRLRAPAVPHDINFRSWGALSEGPLAVERGLGLPALGRVLHPFIIGWDRDETWLFHVVAVLGALAPVCLFAWLRLIATGTTTAWIAAAMFTIATPHVRFSHTDAQQIPSLTFALLGLAAWAAHTRKPSWLAALTGAAALTVAACGRLECVGLAVVVVGLSVLDGLPWRHPATWCALAITAVLSALHLDLLVAHNPAWDLAVYRRSGWALLTDHPLMQLGWQHFVVLDLNYTSWLFAVLMVWGVFTGTTSLRARVGCALAVLLLSALVPGWSPIHGEALAIARYQLAALPFASALAAGGVATFAKPWAAENRPTITALVASVTLASSAIYLHVNYLPTTHSSEYRFIRDELPKLPTGCVLLYDTWTHDIGLSFPTHLQHMLRRDLALQDVATWTPDATRCTIYYRAATCWAAASEGVPTPDCVGPGPGYQLTPLAEAMLPARQWVYDRYSMDPMRAGFYTVTP